MKNLISNHRRGLLVTVVVAFFLLASVLGAVPGDSKVHSDNGGASKKQAQAASGEPGLANAGNGNLGSTTTTQIRKGTASAVNSAVTLPPQPPAPQSGGTFDITSSVIAGGGGSSTSVSPNFRLDGTAGQAAAGTTMSSGQFSLTGGFWQPEGPLSTVAISGTIHYPCGSTMPVVPNTTLTASGDASAMTTSDGTGFYNLSGLSPGTYTVTPSKTTISGSAGVDGADVVAVRRHALGTVLLTGCRLMAGNANQDFDAMGNDIVDSADIVPIRRFALGLLTGTASVGQWKFTPASRNYVSIISDQPNQDYNGLIIGDASGDLIPTSPSFESSKSSSTSDSTSAPFVVNTVSLPTASVATPTVTNFTLPVNTTNIPASDNLVAFQGDFTFDPTVVGFQAPAVTKAGLTAGAIWSVQANLCPPGTTCTPTLQTLRVIGDSDGSIPLSGAGVLFNLNFVRVSTTIGATTPLTWAASPNEFRFIEGTGFTRQHPNSTPPGSMTIGNAPSASNGVVAGRITDAHGFAVSGAVVRLSGTHNRKTITDANGNYQFDSVETNGFYTVTPSRANYTFSPSLRSFSQLAERTEAAFSATFTGDAVNPLDTAEYFVRQQYVDVLGREPDEGGFNYWSDQLLGCGNDAPCVNTRRRDLAAAFFIEAEFQQTGSFVYGLYKGSLGRRPAFAEFSSDRLQVVAGSDLDQAKQRFAESFVGRAEFVSRYQRDTTADSFVEALLTNVSRSSGIDLSSQRANLLSRYNAGSNLTQSRSLALRALIDTQEFRQAEYNSAFVLTEYFSYLRRDPESAGYDYWLNVLNTREPNNYRGMVCAFITSREYQGRFSSVVSHTDAECGP